MPGKSSFSPSSPPAGSAGFSAFVDSLRTAWRPALLHFAGALVGLSLLWAVAAPGYARGLAVVGRLLSPALEQSPSTRYEVEGARVLAHRTLWLPKRRQTLPLVQPLWTGSQNFGPPLLAALILATPGWRWRRRGRALVVGLALLTVTQVAYLVITIEATQHSPVMSPEGLIQPARQSPLWQPILYWLYYFFDIMGRGFFALLIYVGVVARLWGTAAPATAPAGRNSPCPCGSGLKYKRCCGLR
jgi:hypothetical protein